MPAGISEGGRLRKLPVLTARFSKYVIVWVLPCQREVLAGQDLFMLYLTGQAGRVFGKK